MKKIIFIFSFSVLFFPLFSQISMTDFIVQVVSYGNKNDKQTYLITQSSYKITNTTDTTERTKISYLMDIEVGDSTKNSYVLEMRSHDIKVEEIKDKRLGGLYKIGENSKILIKTTAMGEYL